MGLTIQQLANRCGVARDTLRYWERRGLLTPKSRNKNNYRVFDESALERVRFIQSGQSLGFTLAEIENVLDAQTETNCHSNIEKIVRYKLAQTKAQLSQLAFQKDRLEAALHFCEGAEKQKPCSFFEYLAGNHSSVVHEIETTRHAYLYEVADWVVEGEMRNNGHSAQSITGQVKVGHSPKLWSVYREFHAEQARESGENITFYLSPIPREDAEQEFAAQCSVFGGVIGKIGCAGDSIHKTYEMENAPVHGVEHIKRIHTNLYEATGALFEKQHTIVVWRYEMARLGG